MPSIRSHTLRFGLALLLGSSVGLAASIASVASPQTPDGDFRVSRGIAAPWMESALPPAALQSWIGKPVSFSATRFSNPAFPDCGEASYEIGMRPPEGLFQGVLPAPAKDAAARLALTQDTIASVTVTCDAGLFDLHWATPDALLLGLDNVIWVLDRSPGALAGDATPEHIVQAMLERHFAGDMGFSRESVAAKREFLSDSLQASIAAYFAHPHPADEPPPINGDPITDAQEYPVLFSVQAARREGDLVLVPVRYDDGYRSRQVQFVLRQAGDAWRIDDLRYEYGGTLREALSTTP